MSLHLPLGPASGRERDSQEKEPGFYVRCYSSQGVCREGLLIPFTGRRAVQGKPDKKWWNQSWNAGPRLSFFSLSPSYFFFLKLFLSLMKQVFSFCHIFLNPYNHNERQISKKKKEQKKKQWDEIMILKQEMKSLTLKIKYPTKIWNVFFQYFETRKKNCRKISKADIDYSKPGKTTISR